MSDSTASGPTQPATATTPDLYHLSVNPECDETIVLLHGLLSSHLEYTEVVPRLSKYHLLLVDLPGHGESRSFVPPASSSTRGPYHMATVASLVATLIQQHAHHGKAHVVGLSMGGHIALSLLSQHPALVRSVWVTGASPLSGTQGFMSRRPRLIYHLGKVAFSLPDSLYWWSCRSRGMIRHEELLKVMRGNLWGEKALDVMTDVYGAIMDVGWSLIEELGAGSINGDGTKCGIRVLVIAGGQEDDVEATRKMGTMLRKRFPEARAVVVKKAIHPWDLQFPDVFGKGISAWIERRDLPPEYEELEDAASS